MDWRYPHRVNWCDFSQIVRTSSYSDSLAQAPPTTRLAIFLKHPPSLQLDLDFPMAWISPVSFNSLAMPEWCRSSPFGMGGHKLEEGRPQAGLQYAFSAFW